MLIMKKLVLIVLLILLSTVHMHADSNKATAQDVYDLVIKAYDVIKNLGEAALPAFNDPKGEFVYKDTYVYLMKCPSEMAAHPYAMGQLRGVDLNKFPHTKPICDAAANPNGGWTEYFWPKPGEKEPSRKVGFSITVEGTPYQVCAGIFNETDTVEALNRTLR
jgi:cytochrome c